MYTIALTDRADDDLSRLDRVVARRVNNRLRRLAELCDSYNHHALTGPHAGKYRLRVGDYRALYTIDWANRRIEVETIGHRSDVY